MNQGRIPTNQNNYSDNNFDDHSEFSKLKESLISHHGFSLDLLTSLEEKINFDMTYNKITAQSILFEIEANFMNNKESTDEKSLLTSCLEKCIQTMNKGKKKPIQPKRNTKEDFVVKNVAKNIEDNFSLNNNIMIDDENKDIKFEIHNSFNEKNLSNPHQYNSKEISYTFFSNLEIKEYNMVPKDDEVNYEEYTNYFKFCRKQFLESVGIDLDNPLLDVDKFFLLVTFANYEGKPLLSDIELIDPLKNFTKYNLRIENDNLLKEFYFFPGQMLFIEGHEKNKEIFAQKIVFGINPTSYTLSEPYVRGFFQDPNPFLIYALNGPIFNKTNLNLNVFIKTLTHIASENPHALIINGPIVNVDNQMIMSGEIRLSDRNEESCMNYFELFEFVLNKINEIFCDKRTNIILTPSLSDVTTYYPLPQPPYNFSNLNKISNLEIVKKGKLKLIGNPQIFQLNETIIGVANFDVVRDMISNSSRSSNKVPLDSSLEMLLQQRSFYPILPNNVNSDEIDKMDKTISLDIRKLKDLHIGAVPDIIITPTWNIGPFVRKVSSTLFVNPGYLMKTNTPGSFVKITSYPPTNSTGVDILNRVKIDIMKISYK